VLDKLQLRLEVVPRLALLLGKVPQSSQPLAVPLGEAHRVVARAGVILSEGIGIEARVAFLLQVADDGRSLSRRPALALEILHCELSVIHRPQSFFLKPETVSW
jgi:hypothetical protein